MKSIFLLFIVFVLNINSYSQEVRISGSVGFAIYSTDIIGSGLTPLPTLQVAPRNAKFYVVGDAPGTPGYVIIQFLNWYTTDNAGSITPFEATKFQVYNFNINGVAMVAPGSSFAPGADVGFTPRFFAALKTNIETLSSPYYVASFKTAQFSLGFIVMPAKLRLKDFDFSDQFSIGATAGVKWRISNRQENYLHLLGGVNIGVVDIDSTNSTPINTDVRKSLPAKSIAVLSPAAGLVASFGGAQVGLFFGLDYLGKSNREKYNWTYNKKLWMAVGVGFNLFTANKQSSATASPEQNR